jgi:RNA polymerase sigma-70 factor, ECF subfamily
MQLNKLNTKKDLEELFKNLNEAVFRYIYIRCGYNRELAEDLTQDVFIKAWEKRTTFNPKKSSLKNWIYSIARNHIIDFYRSRQLNSNNNIDSYASRDDVITSTENNLMVNKVIECLEQLQENEKEILVLRYIQDLDINDVSKIINKNYIATKVMLFRAKKKLKKFIEK